MCFRPNQLAPARSVRQSARATSDDTVCMRRARIRQHATTFQEGRILKRGPVVNTVFVRLSSSVSPEVSLYLHWTGVVLPLGVSCWIVGSLDLRRIVRMPRCYHVGHPRAYLRVRLWHFLATRRPSNAAVYQPQEDLRVWLTRRVSPAPYGVQNVQLAVGDQVRERGRAARDNEYY